MQGVSRVSLRSQHLVSLPRSSAGTKVVNHSSLVPPAVERYEHLGLAPMPCLLRKRSALTSPPEKRVILEARWQPRAGPVGRRSEGAFCHALPFRVCSVTMDI